MGSEQPAVPIKSESKSGRDTSITEYRNIKEGPQADSLFEIPAGYQKFALPSLGGLFGGK